MPKINTVFLDDEKPSQEYMDRLNRVTDVLLEEFGSDLVFVLHVVDTNDLHNFSTIANTCKHNMLALSIDFIRSYNDIPDDDHGHSH